MASLSKQGLTELCEEDYDLASDEEAKTVKNPKKAGGSSTYKVAFKSEWKKSYPVLSGK